MDKKEFGLFLCSLRNERKISQEKLAELAEVDRTYISLLERGKRQPTLTTLYNLSKAFDITLPQLMELFQQYYDKK